MAIKKRREHGLETWIALLDLAKAFDRVPRELLWEIMPKLGVPPKMVSLLKLLFRDAKCKLAGGLAPEACERMQSLSV